MRRKRNPYYDPFDYAHQLAEAIYSGMPTRLSKALNYQKIGEKCKDCNEMYHSCECEACDDCMTKYCVCNHYKNSVVSGKITSKIAWNLALQLNDNIFEQLIWRLIYINDCEQKMVGNKFAEKIIKKILNGDIQAPDLDELRKIK